MKKKIFIWMSSMHLGGAERSLVGLLQSLDRERVEIDLFLNRHEGELMCDIPEWINLLAEEKHYACLAEPMTATLKRGYVLIFASRMIGKLAAKLKGRGASDGGISVEYSHKYTKWLMPKVCRDTVYDLAISFITPHYFVSEKVNAKKKIAWIHTDYTNSRIDIASQSKMWGKYDRIISISESVSESFAKVFPNLGDRLFIVENILPAAPIISKSKEFDVSGEMPRGKEMRILSVGRFSYAKNFDNVPEICSNILKSGVDVKWYLIGYGSAEALIRSKIAQFGVQDNVIILGKKDNPYPYIAECDLYVQPSRYEGKAVTVREAQILCKPVAITAFETAQSQLQDGVDGVIVPMDNAGCAEKIAELLSSKEQMQVLSDACSERDFSSSSEAQKIYEILDL